jgi:hypothetical protein
MTNNDDIMRKIDTLHGETMDDIAKIHDEVMAIDKKVDIHIAVAKVVEENMEKNQNRGSLTKNQKYALLISGIGVFTGIITYIITTFG